MKKLLILFILLFSFSAQAEFKKGFTYLKWGTQFIDHADRSFVALKATGTKWVSFVPIYYMDKVDSTDIYLHPILSPTDEELINSIKVAQSYGFKILLKPHIDVMNDPWKAYLPKTPYDSKTPWLNQYKAFIEKNPIKHDGPSNAPNWIRKLFKWRGDIRPTSKEDIKKWFVNYNKFILKFAKIAKDLNVELFCVGTEFEKMVSEKQQWQNTIKEVRKIYNGEIFYDANHDGYKKVKFWDRLDYIGLSGYFPVSSSLDPSENEIRETLNKELNSLEKFVKNISVIRGRNYKVLFGEAGYTDFRGTTKEPWNFILTNGVSFEEQARAYRVSIELYQQREWLHGVFFWRWNVEPEDVYFEYDHYTPYGKPAETEIRKAWK